MARKTKKQVEDERARQIVAIRTLWTSLESHLDLCVKEVGPKVRGEIGGGRKFHADTVREYAQAINELAKNL